MLRLLFWERSSSCVFAHLVIWLGFFEDTQKCWQDKLLPCIKQVNRKPELPWSGLETVARLAQSYRNDFNSFFESLNPTQLLFHLPWIIVILRWKQVGIYFSFLSLFLSVLTFYFCTYSLLYCLLVEQLQRLWWIFLSVYLYLLVGFSKDLQPLSSSAEIGGQVVCSCGKNRIRWTYITSEYAS